jgi:hypothetical protein
LFFVSGEFCIFAYTYNIKKTTTMKKPIKLFESFIQEAGMETGKGELWARVFHPDLLIYGVHSSLEEAQRAEEVLARATAAEYGEDPDEFMMDESETDIIRVNPSDNDEAAMLMEYCINTADSFDSLIKSPAIQNPRMIVKKLIRFGVNPFAASDENQGFSNQEELNSFLRR